jgi:hypothetical protein
MVFGEAVNSVTNLQKQKNPRREVDQTHPFYTFRIFYWKQPPLQKSKEELSPSIEIDKIKQRFAYTQQEQVTFLKKALLLYI